MFCGRCGRKMKDNIKFCPYCGYGAPDTTEKEPISKKGGRRYPALAGILIAVITILIVGGVIKIVCNPVRQIMQNIEEDDFASAANVYHEKIAVNADQSKKACEKVSAYVENLQDEYKNEKIEYERMIRKLNGIKRIGILGKELDQAYKKADKLYSYRKTYTAAEKALKDEDYGRAATLFNKVAGKTFENGETAKEKYKQAIELYRTQVVTSAQEHIEANEYSEALDILEEGFLILPDDPELLDVQESCMSAEYDYTIQQYIDNVHKYMEDMDYAGALECLDGYIGLYPQENALQKEKENCLTEFETYVAEHSLELAKKKDYQQAVSVAESGLQYFSSSRVSELIEIYKSHIPVILGEMEMFQNNTKGGMEVTDTDKRNEYLEDNYNNRYENSLSVGKGSVTYLVNHKYQTFSGTVAFPKGLESDECFKVYATLIIYGDEEKIAEFAEVDEATRPESFSLDISAYERIKLEWICEGFTIWLDWGDFATIFDGMFIPVPQELPDKI